ncbi:crotonobetainyl-CoA--carnitine CoA-transferase [bacterium]|jgi:hypothetical protein|nr:crotonobetainyl-CoA--carnitine CoA-transferase [bacterium]
MEILNYSKVSGSIVINRKKLPSWSDGEKKIRKELFSLFKNSPIPDDELLTNIGLYIRRQDLSKILFKNELYQKCLNVHGVIMEFGVHWGQSLALFESFRGIYEPHNFNRKIIGFDTFEGFPNVHDKDGESLLASIGEYSVTDGYKDYLERILDYHEFESPISHMKKYELVKGDVTVTIGKYLEEHPETIVSFAYFDLDLYQPTVACLEAIKNNITKGTVLGFDELNNKNFPGETLALKEVLGLNSIRIQHSQLVPDKSFIVIE